jgi:uncharacterized alkaline shock family protein YloU
MALTKKTDLGTITLSDDIFAEILSDVFQEASCGDSIWLSTRRGRMITKMIYWSDSELKRSIDCSFDEQGRVSLRFSVVVRFGISIRRVTGIIADQVAKRIEEVLGSPPSVITIEIAGVRSRQTARRNTKVVYRYENHG